MGRLKMLVVAALTAATIGGGALAAAPSASAAQNERTAFCAEIDRRATFWTDKAVNSRDWPWPLSYLHSYYSHQADLYTGIYDNSCL
jgi:hypothetical protein